MAQIPFVKCYERFGMKHHAGLHSANDWLTKAGARIQANRVILPHTYLLVPLTLASEGIVDFRAAKNLSERIKHAVVVALMVRIADSAFYNVLAKMLNAANPHQQNLCGNCLRGQICGTKMRDLRREINTKIIHKMESAIVIEDSDLSAIERYYEEIFRLPLVDPVEFPERKITLCQKCAQSRRT